jgi:hypothetical protein
MAAELWIASLHLLSHAVVSQSISESWCIKYSVGSSMRQNTTCVYVYVSVPSAFFCVCHYRKQYIMNSSFKQQFKIMLLLLFIGLHCRKHNSMI